MKFQVKPGGEKGGNNGALVQKEQSPPRFYKVKKGGCNDQLPLTLATIPSFSSLWSRQKGPQGVAKWNVTGTGDPGILKAQSLVLGKRPGSVSIPGCSDDCVKSTTTVRKNPWGKKKLKNEAWGGEWNKNKN